MLIPKKVKHRKWQKGTRLGKGVETRGTKLSFGSFGLKAMEHGRINSRHIEASRRAMTKYLKRGGQVWIRIFPDKPVTKKPPEVTMGGGKGATDHYVTVIKPGRVLFEMDGIPADIAKEALRLAAFKLPIKTKFIFRESK